MSHAELIERLEKATGPNYALDVAIGQATAPEGWRVCDDGSTECWVPEGHEFGEGWMQTGCPLPNYTSSIDAALTLVESGSEFEVGSAYLVGAFWASVIDLRGRFDAKGARTPAIALCIAALKARASIDT